MESKRKLTPVAQAYQRSKIARDALHAMDARCMETTEDKYGIVWERWIVFVKDANGVHGDHLSVILYATPSWWDVFKPVTNAREIPATIEAIKALKD